MKGGDIINASDIIQIVSIVVNVLVSIVTIWIAISSLKESSKAIFESNRAYISFFVLDTMTPGCKYLVIKNFGNSGGRLLKIVINPNLDYSKSQFNIETQCITDSTNIYLAPNQSIKSLFSFRDYPDRIFNVFLEYETCGRKYNEQYEINLKYIDNEIKASISSDDQTDILKAINKSIQEVSERLL